MPVQPLVQAASSLPTGGTFTAGAGKISASGNVLTITQSSLKGIIDWNTFSIGNGAAVSFRNGSGATLNLVTGSMPSTLLGQLLATGSIYLLNPEGVLIGSGATVRTGGDFVASTLTLPAAQFLSSTPLLFSGSSGATVVNLGSISSSGGNIYLIGRSVENGGSISSPNGTSGLAAGSQVLISDSSAGQKVAVEAPGGDVTNSGFINAVQVELKSNGGNIYALAGNNGGRINATGTANIDGHVWLIATNGTANVAGAITATNSNGQGGDIETSGSQVNAGGALIKTGKGGSWLLDPDDLTIDSTLAATIDSTLNGGTNVTEQTGNGNTGTGDIYVNSPIAWTTGANLTLSAFKDIWVNAGISNTGAGNLTLRADNTSNGTGTIGGGGVIDFSGSTGYVSLLYNPNSYATPGNYSSNFGAVHGGWTAPADGSVSRQYTAYMLVNSAANLQNLDANDAGTYALGTNIDLSSIPNFTPLGSSSGFSGILDGMGHTISDLTISGLTTNSGLFATIAAAGYVRNLNLANANVSVTNAYTGAGTLAGEDLGTIANVSASGAVTIAQQEENVGGLVGYLYGGTILNSHANVTVSATQASYYVGGLVGYDYEGVITNSYATGSVSAQGDYVGGLVGYDEDATTTNSYATGTVSMTDGSDAGGLIGYSQSSTITGSHATGTVSSATTADVGGLVGETYGTPVTNSYATGSVSGVADSVGGLIGYQEDGPVSNSYATGNVAAGGGAYVGGLTGTNADVVSTSYALGSVTGGTGAYIGGLTGWAGWNLTDTYARGAVTATGTGAYIGGLAGWLAGAPITRSYSSGLVTAPSPAAAGGLLGNNNAGTITSSYWDDQSSGFSTIGVGTGSSTGTTGLTTAQLKSGNMPSGFNPDLSDSPWVSPAGVYPYFGWQGALVPIEGTASNGAALGAAGVGVLWNGSLIASTTTLSNGTYGVEVPQNMTVGGVLTYLTSGGVANAFTDGTGPEHFLDMELGVGNLYIVNAASTTLSGLTNALATTIGSLTGANFLYTVSSGLLHLNSGANLYFGSYQSFTFDRPLSVPGSILFEDLQSVTIANSSPITAGSGDHIEILVGLQNNASAFVNNAGADALNVSGGGNWLVYSVNPANDITGGLVPAFLQYSASQGATPAQSGNGLLYSIAPIITPSLTGTVGKTYDGTTAAALSASNFAVSGAINGDTVTLTTPSSGTFETANVGANITISSAAVSVASATHDGLPVYGYGLSETPASGEIGIITPAMLTYTANTGSRTYGASNPALSGTVTGFVDGQTLSTATSGSATFTSAATATSNVGAYSIDGSGLTANNGNYVFVQADGNSSALTINPATLTYSANTGSRTYGAGNPALSGTVTGFVNGQTLATATSGSVTFTTAATAASNVGTYAIDGSGLTADHGNYVFAQAEGNSTALTINPATLTYTANPVSRPPGASNPVFSGTVTGFVDGQTLASATTGTALFTSAAGTTSAAGGYAIDGSGLTADHGNYVFTQASANASALTVTAAVMPPPPPTPTPTPTVLNFVIGNTSALQSSQPTFTAAYTGAAINGLDIASILSGLTFTITPAISGPGTYAITAAGTAPHGYTLNIAPATLTIVGSTSAILPSQAPLINPVLPELLPSAGGNDSTSLLPPLNSVGLFQVNVPAAGGNSGASLNVLGNQQQPLAQSGFFGTSDKKDTYSAGAKP